MKNTVVTVIFLYVSVMVGLGACEKKKYNISITEMNLGSRSEVCDSLRHLEPAKIYIANSQGEYEAMFDKITAPLPQIDFSNSTVIFVYGGVQCLLEQNISFFKDETNIYTLNIDILQGLGQSVESWYTAFYTNEKINSHAMIKLNINKHF